MPRTIVTIASLLIASAGAAVAQNPIVQTMYTADPAPLVHNGRLYLYTGHDEDQSTWFVMNDWKLYSTGDMVNWTDHGAVASYRTFSWAKGDAWALHVIERRGKFYMYAPVRTKETNSPAVGVAVADSPFGPFIDPLGKPLVQSGKGDIDPTVFVDDDGQAYLYWGNPLLYYVKLNDDMISVSGDIVKVPMTEASFGKRAGNVPDRPTLYEEGPWLYKRNALYYLLFAAGPIPEHIAYATGSSATGPWQNRGALMPQEGRSFTNHPAIVDFRGKTYFFYHNGALPGGNGFNRSVAVQEARFSSDGRLEPMKMEPGIAKSLQPLDPFQKMEAETIAWSEGVKAAQNAEVGVFVNAVQPNAFTQVKAVDFGEVGASKLTARVGTTHNTGVSMEVRLDAKDGPLLGTMAVPLTGGNDRWVLTSIAVPRVTGVHDVFFVFKGEKPGTLMYFDYWMASK